MNLLRRILNHFHCQHLHLSRVWTQRWNNSPAKRHYVTCLDCGVEIPYNLEEMHLGTTRARRYPSRTIHAHDRS